MTFTPGPWEANRWRVCAGCGEGERISVICDTAHNMKTRTVENEANARLIAAAPDLLEAIDELTVVVGLTPVKSEELRDTLQKAYDKARAAIKKARA